MTDESPRLKYKTFAKPRAIRLEGWDYTSPHPYHAIMTTHKRQPLFRHAVNVGVFVDVLRARTAHTHFTVFAFCVMPDHVHILCQPDPVQPVSLIDYIQHIKRTTSLHLHQLGVEGTIWQRGFYDHILRDEEKIDTVINYILANPWRAELVDDYTKYPYSFGLGIKPYNGPRDVPIPGAESSKA